MNKKNILVIAPHQDDETIGCGGTISKLVTMGYDVKVVHVFSGTSGVPDCSPADSSRVRHKEAITAGKRGGYTVLDNLGFVDRDRSQDHLIQSRLIDLLRAVCPDIVFAPHVGESDYEHRVVSIAAREAAWLSATEIFPDLGPCMKTAPRILFYEVWKNIDKPVVVSDITKYQNKKQEMLQDFPSQMAQTDWVDGSLGNARYRGATTVGRGSVEVFEATGISIEEIL